jgi:hypothetical protein
MLRIRVRNRMFLDHPDPDTLVRYTDPEKGPVIFLDHFASCDFGSALKS